MSCSNQTICYTSPHLSLHVPFFFLLIILTHCYVIVNSFYYPPLQSYLQYKKSFHYISNPSCVGLITALCSLSNSNIVISFLIMLIGTLLCILFSDVGNYSTIKFETHIVHNTGLFLTNYLAPYPLYLFDIFHLCT